MGWEMGHKSDYQDLVRHWPNRWTQRTYRLTPELVDRLNATARDYQVGVSDLVRYLLTVALDQVESGGLEIPTRTSGLRRIDYCGRGR